MSNGPTLRERIAIIETMLGNHIKHHDKRDKWMMGILSGLVIGVILLALRLWVGVI